MTPAAQYLRVSTDEQRYSLHNQAEAIRDYAESHRFTIVQTYCDLAKSGLVLRRRAGLRQLLSDVASGKQNYRAVLVYDVSRWGRFQDTDESAHYEFLCKAAGVPVLYCAEIFENDRSLASSLMKALKRSMAGLFSRELGIRVSEGKRRIVKAGFYVGGRAPYGFRRRILSQDSSRCRILEAGERKNVRSERLTLVHGPSNEVRCVREIFRKFLRDQMTPREIARDLNFGGLTQRGRRWTLASVGQVLGNSVYAGSSVWGRTSQRLGSPRTRLSPDQWALKFDSFPPIVSRSDFDRVQELMKPDHGRVFWTRERVLKSARQLLNQNGELSRKLFDMSPRVPSSTTLRRFSFIDLCRSLGYELPKRYLAASLGIKNNFRLHREILQGFAAHFPDELKITRGARPRLLLDDRVVVSLRVCKSVCPTHGKARWRISPGPAEDIPTVVCLLNSSNSAPQSFYVFPQVCLQRAHRFGENGPWLASGTRVEDVSQLCTLLRRAAAACRES